MLKPISKRSAEPSLLTFVRGRRVREPLIVAALGCVLLTTGPVLAADQDAKCTIHEMLGYEKSGGIDRRLSHLKKQLTQAPFSAFKTFKLLAVKGIVAPQRQKAKTVLSTGKVLSLTFKEKLLEKKGDVRLRMHLSIAPPKSKKYLPGTIFTIVNGGTLLVAGDKHEGGTVVVGITCVSQ